MFPMTRDLLCLSGLEGGGHGNMLVKGYKLPVLRWISSGNSMHSIETIINKTVLYTWKLQRE